MIDVAVVITLDLSDRQPDVPEHQKVVLRSHELGDEGWMLTLNQAIELRNAMTHAIACITTSTV